MFRVRKVLQGSISIGKFSRGVLKGLQGSPSFLEVLRGPRKFRAPKGPTRVQNRPKGSTRVHKGPQGSTRVHRCPKVLTRLLRVYKVPQGFRRVHNGPQGSLGFKMVSAIGKTVSLWSHLEESGVHVWLINVYTSDLPLKTFIPYEFNLFNTLRNLWLVGVYRDIPLKVIC